MHSIFYTPESEDNLADIFEFISNDNTFYAAKVLSNIKSTIDILKLFPLSWTPAGKGQRMIVDSNYGYRVVYKIISNKVYILSVSKYKNLWK